MTGRFWFDGKIVNPQGGIDFTTVKTADLQATTLRDTFACAALQGFLAAYVWNGDADISNSMITKYAYEVADAMMLERDKK